MVYVCFAILGMLLLLSSKIMTNPFSIWSTYYETVICIFVAHFITQIVVLSMNFPLCRFRFKLETVHYIVAMLSYAIILIYKQNVVLAVIGMVAQLPAFFGHLSKLILPVFCGKMYIVNLILWISSILGCCAALPITFLVLANQTQPLSTLHPTPYFSFWLTVIYFSFVFLNSLRVALIRLYKTCTHDDSSECPTEEDPILSMTKPVSHLNPISNHKVIIVCLP